MVSKYLHFQSHYILTRFDSLAISEGNSTSSWIGCGQNAPHIYISVENSLSLTFISDHAISGAGFQILYACVTPSTDEKSIVIQPKFMKSLKAKNVVNPKAKEDP